MWMSGEVGLSGCVFLARHRRRHIGHIRMSTARLVFHCSSVVRRDFHFRFAACRCAAVFVAKPHQISVFSNLRNVEMGSNEKRARPRELQIDEQGTTTLRRPLKAPTAGLSFCAFVYFLCFSVQQNFLLTRDTSAFSERPPTSE